MNNPRYSGYQGGSAVQSAPALLGQVLGITGVGFLITALAAYLFQDISQMFATIAFFAGFAMIFIMRSVRRNPAVALLWFYAFTFVEGVGLAPMIARYVAVDGSEVVVNAALTTGFGMLTLAAVAFTLTDCSTPAIRPPESPCPRHRCSPSPPISASACRPW